jgi:hypothetical protein
VRYTFPAADGREPILLTWTHGKPAPAVFTENQVPGWAWGVFVGDQGALAVNYGRRALLPVEKYQDHSPPEPTISTSAGHHQEWIQACKTGTTTLCNFDYSGAVTESVLLGNIAYRVGETLRWDGANMRFADCPAAAELLQREYRDGWELA